MKCSWVVCCIFTSTCHSCRSQTSSEYDSTFYDLKCHKTKTNNCCSPCPRAWTSPYLKYFIWRSLINPILARIAKQKKLTKLGAGWEMNRQKNVGGAEVGGPAQTSSIFQAPVFQWNVAVRAVHLGGGARGVDVMSLPKCTVMMLYHTSEWQELNRAVVPGDDWHEVTSQRSLWLSRRPRRVAQLHRMKINHTTLKINTATLPARHNYGRVIQGALSLKI